MKKIFCTILIVLPLFLQAQEQLKGKVMATAKNGDVVGLQGVSVYWAGSTIGTISNEQGEFSIAYEKSYKSLVFSYVGYKTDTVIVKSLRPFEHVMREAQDLDEVVVKTKKKKSSVSYLYSANILTVNEDELLKAACCNLSESFATNPSIDVNFSDALTGTKQIKLLGLTSPYILIAQENIPNVRGAAQAYGLTFTPGTWIESIQITKGAGSVVNGYESIAGQINTELKKPTAKEKLFVNAFGSSEGRLELNTHVNQKVSDRWSTSLFLHGNMHKIEHDTNNDGFLDMPIYDQVNVLNRWQYTDVENGFVSFLNFRYLKDNKQTGQVDFNPDTDKFSNLIWGSEINTSRVDASAKLGYVFPETPYESVGFQFAYSNHDQNAYFGLRNYDIEHQSIYANGIFNSILGSTLHKFKAGLNYTYDEYIENVDAQDYSRNERSVGGFFEYNFDNLDDFSLIAGLRMDVHNLLGVFVTPRLHVRYAPWAKGVLRASVGRGKRSANIFAENQKIFGSSRQIDLRSTQGKIYGMNPEVAWNYGVSYLQGFNVFGKNAELTVDYYTTRFENKVIIDYDENPQSVVIYDAENGAYASNLQVQLNYTWSNAVDFRFAYKYYDVKSPYLQGDMSDPLQAKHRFFANAGYESTRNAKGGLWRFDVTYNWIGEQRLPFTGLNPVPYQLPENSPSYSLVNAQMTKVFSNTFEVYVGGENIGAYQQKNAIVASNDPFGPYFDTSQIYAPIYGAMYYAGLRFKLF
ncbi:TonB-dependent receptor [Flavobacteriaceae bacterium F08102]|nr:TonB-dependent receptor [Flavobacteriaceae bacterium F08102]